MPFFFSYYDEVLIQYKDDERKCQKQQIESRITHGA